MRLEAIESKTQRARRKAGLVVASAAAAICTVPMVLAYVLLMPAPMKSLDDANDRARVADLTRVGFEIGFMRGWQLDEAGKTVIDADGVAIQADNDVNRTIKHLERTVYDGIQSLGYDSAKEFKVGTTHYAWLAVHKAVEKCIRRQAEVRDSASEYLPYLDLKTCVVMAVSGAADHEAFRSLPADRAAIFAENHCDEIIKLTLADAFSGVHLDKRSAFYCGEGSNTCTALFPDYFGDSRR